MTASRFSGEEPRSPGSETPRRWRRGAPRRSAGQSRWQGVLRSCTNKFVQGAPEAFARPRLARVAREVRVVDAVELRDAERRGAALGGRSSLDVDASADPGGEEVARQRGARTHPLE